MKDPHHYHRLAALARRDALGLAVFSIACVAAMALIGDGCRGGQFWWVPLALLAAAVAAAGGALIELADAGRWRRFARMEETHQPHERV
jgi:hypothetical protein